MKATDPLLPGPPKQQHSYTDFLKRFLPLELAAFGGPTAHVALLRQAFVEATDGPRVPGSAFMEIFALSNALPGSSSSQLVTSLGATFGGPLGAALACCMWHLPGVVLMTLTGMWFHTNLQAANATEVVARIAEYGIGLIAAAFAMVVIASMKIADLACGVSQIKTVICLFTASAAVLIPPSWSSWAFLLLLICGGGVMLFDHYIRQGSAGTELNDEVGNDDEWKSGINTNTGVSLLALFATITMALTVWTPQEGNKAGFMLKTFWRIGWTVVGGGQVVIPMILNEVVESGWLPDTVFLSGFGLIGIAPGPMFNIAPFLGAAMLSWKGALYAGMGMLLPGFLLMLGILPFWDRIRKWTTFRLVFLAGLNAAASGLIVASVWMLMRRALVGPLAFVLSVCAGVASHKFEYQTPQIIFTSGVVGMTAVTLGIGKPYR